MEVLFHQSLERAQIAWQNGAAELMQAIADLPDFEMEVRRHVVEG